jgi:hypothetical protein
MERVCHSPIRAQRCIDLKRIVGHRYISCLARERSSASGFVFRGFMAVTGFFVTPCPDAATKPSNPYADVAASSAPAAKPHFS